MTGKLWHFDLHHLSASRISLRKFPNHLIINLDETPLPFEFLNGYSYNFKGAKTVAGRSERSRWDKRQTTIVLYIMADGSTSFKPVIIFHGKETVAKRERYNEKVEVHFNKTAYNNKELFYNWLKNNFEPYIAETAEADETSLIVMNAASFHKTEAILDFIRNSKAPMTTALIPSGLTNLLQPLNTAVNGPFKQLLQKEADIYICELVDTGKMPDPWTLRDRRKMATIIVGRAWERLQKDPELIKRAFL
jgi:hypothetical protein